MAELEETDDDEVKGEIIQNSLIAFADYMASNPIPFLFVNPIAIVSDPSLLLRRLRLLVVAK
jgi:hypothetical protein